jgi:hypothetical protein
LYSSAFCWRSLIEQAIMAMKNCSVRGSMARDSSDLALTIQPAQPFGIMNKNSVGDFLDTTAHKGETFG